MEPDLRPILRPYINYVLAYYRKHVPLGENQVFLIVELEFGPGGLGVKNASSLPDLGWNPFAGGG